MPTITVQGVEVDILGASYRAGLVINEAEASVLNQIWAENIRNNTAAKVREAKDEGRSLAEITKIVREYEAGYSFGVVHAGGRPGVRDQVGKLALAKANAIVVAAATARGITLSKPDQLEKAKLVFAKREAELRAAVEKELAKASKVDDGMDDIFAPPAPAAPPSTSTAGSTSEVGADTSETAGGTSETGADTPEVTPETGADTSEVDARKHRRGRA